MVPPVRPTVAPLSISTENEAQQNIELPPVTVGSGNVPKVDSFLDLVVSNNQDLKGVGVRASNPFTEAQHRLARRRVFETVVQQALQDNPNSPYRSFAMTPAGREMQEAIIQLLVDSPLSI